MLTVLKRVLEKVVTLILKIFTGTLQRALVVLSLFISVMCCVLFIYGLYAHSTFYCFFSIVGVLSFVYVNKQT